MTATDIRALNPIVWCGRDGEAEGGGVLKTALSLAMAVAAAVFVASSWLRVRDAEDAPRQRPVRWVHEGHNAQV